MTAQERFDRYFRGVWEPRWWYRMMGDVPDRLRVESFWTDITGKLHSVTGVRDDGRLVDLNLLSARSIIGWRRMK